MAAWSANRIKPVVFGVLLTTAAPLAASVAADYFFGQTPYVHEPLHQLLEVAGCCIALMLALVLFLRAQQDPASVHLLWIVAALVVMGLLDGVHAIAEFGVSWSWLRHCATFLGGAIFALVWFPVPPFFARRKRMLLFASILVSFGTTGFLLLAGDLLPDPWQGEDYVVLVKAANALGGAGFTAAAAYFIRRYLRHGLSDDLIFSCHALLFASAGMFFGFSRTWGLDWWSWHVFRLAAYAILLIAAYQLVGRLYRSAALYALQQEARADAGTAALQESEERQRMALAAADLGTWQQDLLTGLARLDARARLHFGVDRDILSAAEVFELVHPEDRSALRRAMEASIDPKVKGPVNIEYRVCPRNGTERWLAVRGRVDFVRAGGEDRAVRGTGTTQDITDHKRREEQLAKLTKLYAVLSEVNEAIIRSTSEEGLYSEVCRILAHTGDFPLAWVGRVAGERITPVAWSGPEAGYINGIVVEVQGELGRGPTGTCIRENRAVVNDDFAANPTTAPWREAAIRHGFRASAAFPLRRRGAPIGSLTLYAGGRGAFDAEQVRLLESLSADVSFALDTLAQEQRRAAAEEALRISEECLRLALTAGASGAWDWDMEQDIPSVSDSYRELFGIPPGERFTFESWLAAVHSEDRERCRLYAESVFAARDAVDWRLEFRINTPHRGLRWHRAVGKIQRDANGKPVRFSGLTTDITERVQAEEALRESEERFRTMADGLPLIVWVHDAAGNQKFVNRTFCEFFGLRQEEMAGEKWQEVLHPEDGAAYIAAFAACVSERRTFQAEVRVRRYDGQWRWIESYARPRFAESGDFFGFVGASADVTDRKRAEDALKEADRRKDEFLAMLGHELRNPLAAITTGLRLLRSSSPNRDQLVKDSLERQTKQLVRLVDDLLDVSRITRGKIQLRSSVVDLRTVAEYAVESTANQITEKGHTLSISGLEHPLYIFGDAARLQQVIGNLLSNSAKYTNEAGRIELTLVGEGNAAVVRVRDNGIGIPADMQEAIFELFGQVDSAAHRPQQGLGIGLSLVKMLVQLHGGTVSVASEGDGRGTEFTLRFPLAAQALKETRDTYDALEAQPVDILLVEDIRESAELLARVFTENGHSVRVAGDGCKALALARERQPQVVILDIGLPGMSGYEVAKNLRQDIRYTQTLIIAATGYGQESDRQRSREAGIDYHLVKPIEYETVSLLMREWLRTAAWMPAESSNHAAAESASAGREALTAG